jgi:uroporphyrinogen-III synthase
MAHPIDQTSYHLGVIFAFAEMVAADLKKMALSLPFLPKDHERIVKDAKRIVREEGIRIRLEKHLLTTDLFPEEFTRGKWVFIIYKYPKVLKKYLSLKSKKERLIHEDRYKGKGREAIAVGFGDLLSYRKDVIRKKLKGRGR